jgi:hypothetical protein
MSGGPDHRILYPLYTIMPWQMGNGVVFPLYKVVRETLGWRPGQLLIARIHVPYMTLRVAQPERAIPLDSFGPEVLPPSWPGKEDNATTPNNSKDPTGTATRAHEGDHHR